MAEMDMVERVVDVIPRRGWSGAWTVEAIGDDGEVYQAVFAGPDAERRCRNYAAAEYGIDAALSPVLSTEEQGG